MKPHFEFPRTFKTSECKDSLIYLKIPHFFETSKSGLFYFLPGAEYFLLLLKIVEIQDILQVQGAFSTSKGQYLC